MSDEKIRALERRAQTGDGRALIELARELKRVGDSRLADSLFLAERCWVRTRRAQRVESLGNNRRFGDHRPLRVLHVIRGGSGSDWFRCFSLLRRLRRSGYEFLEFSAFDASLHPGICRALRELQWDVDQRARERLERDWNETDRRERERLDRLRGADGLDVCDHCLHRRNEHDHPFGTTACTTCSCAQFRDQPPRPANPYLDRRPAWEEGD